MQAAKDEDPSNPSVNFPGEKRRNDPHPSTTDPESVLYRKANGQAARWYFGGHVLRENRHGLDADFTIHNPIAEPEPAMALESDYIRFPFRLPASLQDTMKLQLKVQ